MSISVVQFQLCLRDKVADFAKHIFYSLFDDQYATAQEQIVKELFCEICQALRIEDPQALWTEFTAALPEVKAALMEDAEAALAADPAAKSLEEVYLAYPGFNAIAIHRLSHVLYQMGIPTLPRIMSESAHRLTGIDIHPGAEIGRGFFIDHGTGIVIGETTIIRDDVKIFQGVTLGGIKVKKKYASTKRHPTIESHVTIYANATVLGGDVVIGANSIIGANVCVTESVPPGSVLLYEDNYQLSPKV